MTEQEFSDLAFSLWNAVPERFKRQIENVALLVEDEPSDLIRAEEGLAEGDTLLGLYQGVPRTLRGEGYGIGATVPDTITLYRLPILEAAEEEAKGESLKDAIARVTAETLWHEVGHYFGLGDEEIHEREEEGTNTFLGK
ncbi:MAG TPA: metallopeptidase family protein [Candidatus Paceibacterota bacterium]|nr:metallopeptidase family protein [Candidatus Paceibacterota bacterium]